MKRPRSSFFVDRQAPWPSCQMTFQATATTAEDEQMAAHRIALQRLLHHQRQTGKSLCARPYGRSPTRPSHQQESGSSPTQHTIENAAKRLRVNVAIHTETPTAVQLNHHIATLPAGLRFGRRFRGGGLDCRRGTITGINVLADSSLGSSIWQSSLRHQKSWLTWMAAARAISDRTAPGSRQAATSRSLSSRDQRRRRSMDVMT